MYILKNGKKTNSIYFYYIMYSNYIIRMLICSVCDRKRLRKIYTIEDIDICVQCFKIYCDARKLILLQ